MSDKQLNTFNILLADDDADDCLIFAKALQEIPIDTHLTVVNDGEQLMKHLNEHSEPHPHMLFIDLVMPRKSGLECLMEIKNNSKWKDLPVIVFSASYSKDHLFEIEMKSLFSNRGADDFVRKTSDFEKFKQIIQNAIIAGRDTHSQSEKIV